ncbi:hypothetical protein [Paludibacterium sp.]|uniref:hypothetical protein n=1 Tax=Paludibacterium sp. TaxID=1917523 RepID=UPI0025DB37A0|nr:hypothetical protein [Paludibacterium sp.]MBV8648472.1 hypothetical protein [Paludibacterium sp.]
MVIKEWECAKHGTFESTHPICPCLGCASENVKRVFLTPPSIRHEATTYTDNSFNDLARAYKLSDINNQDGQAAKSAADDCKWGMDAVGGVDMFKQATANGAGYETFQTESGKTVQVDNMGMRLAARTSGIDKRVVPAADVKILASDKQDRQKVMKS